MFEIEIKKTPMLRFQAYTEAWKNLKLKDVAVIYDGTHQTPNYKEQGVMFLSVEDIKNLESAKYISEDDFQKEFKIYPQKGDILMTRIGDIGTANIVKSEQRLAYYVSLALFKTHKIDSTFLLASISSNSVQKELWKRTLHIAFPKKINKNEIEQIGINVPQKEEQLKLGTFFKQLNEIINYSQREMELLQLEKRTLISKMFPKEGESFPEIRFNGFTDDWEQRKVSEIAELTSSKRVHAEDYVESGIPFYRGKEISELRIHKSVSEVLYITEEKYEEISKVYGSPKINDILITAVGTIGNTWVVDNLPFYFKDGNLIWFKNIKCNSRYLDYVLSTTEGQKKIMDSAIGSNQKALTMVKLNELRFMFPKEKEQDRIATYFTKLDNLITLHQRKLETIKELKKTLLKYMFV